MVGLGDGAPVHGDIPEIGEGFPAVVLEIVFIDQDRRRGSPDPGAVGDRVVESFQVPIRFEVHAEHSLVSLGCELVEGDQEGIGRIRCGLVRPEVAREKGAAVDCEIDVFGEELHGGVVGGGAEVLHSDHHLGGLSGLEKAIPVAAGGGIREGPLRNDEKGLLRARGGQQRLPHIHPSPPVVVIGVGAALGRLVGGVDQDVVEHLVGEDRVLLAEQRHSARHVRCGHGRALHGLIDPAGHG